MRAYGVCGAHRKATRYLADSADEASVARWGQHGDDLPGWPETVRRMRKKCARWPFAIQRRIAQSIRSGSSG